MVLYFEKQHSKTIGQTYVRMVYHELVFMSCRFNNYRCSLFVVCDHGIFQNVCERMKLPNLKTLFFSDTPKLNDCEVEACIKKIELKNKSICWGGFLNRDSKPFKEYSVVRKSKQAIYLLKSLVMLLYC